MAISKIKIEGDVQRRLPIGELFLEASPDFDAHILLVDNLQGHLKSQRPCLPAHGCFQSNFLKRLLEDFFG